MCVTKKRNERVDSLAALLQLIPLITNNSIEFLGEGTLPWAIFRFRIFSNYFSQNFEKIWKSDNLTMYEKFCLDLY